MTTKAAWQVDFSTAPNDFEYMPAGTHTICCTVNGKPREITVTCDESSAAVFQQSLDAVNAAFDRGEMSRPYIDFDHEAKEAAAFPKRFFWRDGLRLEVEWTEAGRRAVEERRYNYCSPQFLFEETGELRGVSYPGAIGALVNVPAFQTIQKISAKLTQTKGLDMPQDNDKNKDLQTQLKHKDDEIAALKAELADLKKDNDAADKDKAAAALAQKDTELAALKAKLADLEKANAEAAAKAEAARKTSIENRVDALVESGRLKAEAKAAFVAAALASDDNGEALFGGMPEPSDAPLNIGAAKSGSLKPAAKTERSFGLEVAAAAFNKQIAALNK